MLVEFVRGVWTEEAAFVRKRCTRSQFCHHPVTSDSIEQMKEGCKKLKVNLT